VATRTVLSRAQVDEIGVAFGLAPVLGFSSIEAGTINSNFSVRTESGQFFLRVNEGKSRDDIVWEAELVRYLAGAGLETPRTLSTTTGEPCYRFGAQWISMFPWVAGHHLERADVGVLETRSLGAALASLHVCAMDSQLPTRRGIYTFENIVERYQGFRLCDDKVSRIDSLLADEIAFHSQLDRLPRFPGIIHGDLFRDNVLFDEGGISALLDFEQASHGDCLYDLAVCINAWCFKEDFDMPLVESLVRSYLSKRGIVGNRATLDWLYAQCRWAALRFTITRITDVYLRGGRNPDKNFMRYAGRLERLREEGPTFLAGVVS
jgi:homoserine kinase type II